MLDEMENMVVNWPSMRYLNLCECGLFGFPILNTPKLSKLLLKGNNIGLKELCRLKKIKSLRYLALDEVNVATRRAVGTDLIICSKYQ
ncbi:hypothetical protein DASC09_024710 [Saccharomycopsis crataegensis]|uniref:Uncharacterized protein n=1 Tax=Saccharomycopsis crataegensis TaxID=43959 RepID=A0AAV5QKM1_9ASCO|nr:hypothetical protein DASC09_024710 [Saccharomycopsis crataegensis]